MLRSVYIAENEEYIIKRILLISGYDASSHRYWRELISGELSQYDWTQVVLPDRYFYWRARGNALSLAFGHKEILTQDYDLIIVTSMVDITSLRGFCPNLASIPTLVYFHENQFAYPVDESSNLVNIQLLSIYSALTADKVAFNSAYNRDTFLAGCKSLLKRLPDEIPKGIADLVINKSLILPVPLAADIKQVNRSDDLAEAPEIVWNHRWEFDKQPEVFFDALRRLQDTGHRFKLHVLGQSFRKHPEVFDRVESEFKVELLTFGYQSRTDYLNILKQADMVVSSSLHEFQGISMLEAISLGCIPVTPDRLVYKEYVPETLRYQAGGDQEESAALAKKLATIMIAGKREVPDTNAYLCSSALAEYITLIESMCSD